MLNMIRKAFNKYHYTVESIKNRYPCKIISVKGECDFNKEATITYRAVTKFNVRKSTAREILNDPSLIEKFHPTDGVKLGFIAFSELLLKKEIDIDKSRDIFKKISHEMFLDLRD